MFLLTVNGQTKNITADGTSIVQKSKEAVGAVKYDLKSIYYKTKSSMLGQKQNGNTIPDFISEVSLILPHKIRVVSSSGAPLPFSSTKIWNVEKFKSVSEMDVMGRKFIKDDTKESGGQKGLEILEGKVSKDKLTALKNAKKLDPKEVLIESMWSELFPLILTHPFEKDLKFDYIGKAKANNTIANVVDVKSKNGKSYRLLFDAETNYLLMMIVKYKRDDPFFVGDVETKYYFSERELTGGVLIPKKIKVENKQTAAGQAPKIGYQNIEILEFKLNPQLKENLFEIK